jgi:parallel beta-helix repeat protein
MRAPRWTIIPILAILLLAAALALPRGHRGDGDAQSSSLQQQEVARLAQAVQPAARDLRLLDFLPDGYVRDGSVDYRVELQRALDAAAGQTLVLPGFPVRVDRTPGQRFGVILRHGMTLRGTSASKLFTKETALQLLRAEAVMNLRLEGFSVEGPGGDGARLAHGLIQITGGERVSAIDLRISKADAAGIVIAQVDEVLVEGLVVEGASKAGIYLAACSKAIVRENQVRDFGGHRLEFGNPGGVGIQLSSCRDVLCTKNTVEDGLGIGILCNAFPGGARPVANVLTWNHVVAVANPNNPSVSGGIRLANGNKVKETRTHIAANTVQSCGANGIYVENHGSSVVRGNLVQDSTRAGILVGSIVGVALERNVVLESGEGFEPIETADAARRLWLDGNVFGR